MTFDSQIDARNLKLEDVFIKLKDILASKYGKEVFIEILLDTFTTTKRLRAFVSMTGCKTEVEKKEGYYLIRITGSPCCV